jgi:hypothetical protein
MPVDPTLLDLDLPAVPTPVDASTLIAPKGVAPLEWQTYAPTEFRAHKPAPGQSPDLTRILSLPRRERPDKDLLGAAYIQAGHRRWKVERPPPCACPSIIAKYGRKPRPCIHSFKFEQAWSLHELSVVGGLFAVMGVGYGKTVLNVLAQIAVKGGSQKALLLIPVGDLEQLCMTYEMLAQHFKVPTLVIHAPVSAPAKGSYIVPGAPQLHVLPYSRLSRPESSTLIDRIAPDFIIADEVDKLRNVEGAATTKRFLRWFAKAPTTRFACWTGSMTDTSITEFWHLIALALREGSPLPLDKQVVEEWACAIDPDPCPADPGSLLAFCDPGEHIHSGFHRRLRDTMGVITTVESAVKVELVIEERPAPALPHVIAEALKGVRAYVRPDGEELVEASEVQRCAREVACGFYYEWIYPRGEPRDLIDKWFEKRKAYNRAVREVIRAGAEHLDSPKLAEQAAQRFFKELAPGVCKATGEPLPVWECPEWPAWRDIRDQVKPEPNAVRLHPFLAEDAAAWAEEYRGIVWYDAVEFGAWVAELSGLPQFVGGKKSLGLLGREDGSRSIIASIKAHGRGRDGLQRLFDDQLVAGPPASATGWEQLLGRLMRDGQLSERVRTWVYMHIAELKAAVQQAMTRAAYVQGTMGTEQKLLAGTVL